MFTLCLSNKNSYAQDTRNNSCKQVKGGYLLRYRRGLLFKRWSEEWFVLYEDSTLAWFSEKGLDSPKGLIRISETPELLAVGERTQFISRKPPFPRSCHIDQLLVIGTKVPHVVHWLLAQSSSEVNEWMTAINNTLPSSPRRPLESKKYLALATSNKNKSSSNHQSTLQKANCNSHSGSKNKILTLSHPPIVLTPKKPKSTADADHTVLSAVVIDWGHGWGWGHNAWEAHTACMSETNTASVEYCHALGDYATTGFDDMDCGAFGDFIF